MSIVCSQCGGAPEIGRVAHPLHFKGSPGVGKGECRYEPVAYCPKCDPEPNFHGTVEYYDQTFDEYAGEAGSKLQQLAAALERHGPRGSF